MALFGPGEKSVIYRLDIIFSIAHLAQLMNDVKNERLLPGGY